ncbi:hypothetical protein AAMO2058_001438800 [Amorphochlora amoebiformis]
MTDIRVGENFRLGKKINKGAFGEVYLGVNVQTKGKVAIKLENRKTHVPQLDFEGKIYKLLKGGIGIPSVHWVGREGDFNVMVMDLLGKNLEELFQQCGRKFSVKTCIMLAHQMITRVQYLHSKSYTHRDLKPENFAMGLRRRSALVHIIDFGLAKKYRNPKTGEHIDYNTSRSLTGTARYASINSHAGVEASRRDDLESLGYIFVYFLKGSLPWQGIEADRADKYQQIHKIKENTSVASLCEGLPPCFGKYLEYCRGLGFKTTPKYSMLKSLFVNYLKSKGEKFDFAYEWTTSKKPEEKKSPKKTEKKKKIVAKTEKKKKNVAKKSAESSPVSRESRGRMSPVGGMRALALGNKKEGSRWRS